jgi:hypothetical protein
MLGASLPQIGRMMPDPLVETTVTSKAAFDGDQRVTHGR